MNKRDIIMLSLLILILSISSVSAGFLDGMFGENNENITLTDEKTYGFTYVGDIDGETYIYCVDGLFHNLPQGAKDYTLKAEYYDEHGHTALKGEAPSMDFIKSSSDKSKPVELVSNLTHEFKNITNVNLKIYSEDNEIVFDENISFNMRNMDLTGLDEDVPSESDKSDSVEDVLSKDGVYEKNLIADTSSKTYHKPTCKIIGEIDENDKTTINSLYLAEENGYKPCSVCFGD